MPPDLPIDPLALALVVALALAVGLWRWEVGRTGRGNRARQRRARRAEVDAERLLKKAGFRVVERQVDAAWPIRVDGEAVSALVRADLIVARRRRRYVAEVKSGARVTRPDHPQTRRQLLEYQLAYDVDGVLLVDMEAGAVIEVAFPATRTD